jgi:tRNA threonylcarbamoyladenosine biosynthesis protein TsaE
VASIISRGAEETFRLGRDFAASLKPGDVLALCGDLAAGKTQFVKGLAAGLGVATEVTSPTFTLIHEYRGGRLPLYHVDLYRLETEDEALKIGIDEYLESDGVTAIEWADKFAALVPGDARWVRFRVAGESEREIDGLPANDANGRE